MKRPRSQAQIEASRKNGAKSKGPTSPDGKHRSSLSAIRHGLTATIHTLIYYEDPEQYKEVCDAFIADLRPGNKSELRLVEKIANLDWRLERLVMMENTLLNMATSLHNDEILSEFSRIDSIGLIVEAWRRSTGSENCYELLRRYMATCQNQFNSTLSNFEKLAARRRARRLDPDDQLPYLPPVFETMVEPVEPENDPPQPPPIHSEPAPAPIDIRSRQPLPQLPNEPKLSPEIIETKPVEPGAEPQKPATNPPLTPNHDLRPEVTALPPQASEPSGSPAPREVG